MSNTLAIATVTAALQQLLQNLLPFSVPGAVVSIGYPKSPTTIDNKPEVVITLYETTPNSAYRNDDLPTRDMTGKFIHQPCVAVDLYYLLIFYGDEQQLEPQRLLGSTMTILQANAFLTKTLIEQTINSPLYNSFLKNSDLIDKNREKIKFTLHSVSSENLTKLWSSFFNTVPYSLSIIYRASVVLIDANEPIEPEHRVEETPNIYLDIMSGK